MSYVEVETGRYIKRWAFWDPATWSIPKLYWDAWSQEQRIHAICRQLEKVIKYADYLGVNTDDIAARLKAIEDGQLDDVIVTTVEKWFEENAPTIIQDIEDLQNDVNTIENVSIPAVQSQIDDLNDVTIPAVQDQIDTLNNTTIPGIESEIAALSGSTFTVFDTVSDMVSDIQTQEYCYCEGYHQTGKGASFYYVDSSNAQPAISLSNGKYAHPVFDPLNINVSQFGLKGDGTTDETSLLQSVYDYIEPGGTVYLDVDDIYITSTINIEKSDIKTSGAHEWGSKSNIIASASVSTVIRSKGNRNSFEKISLESAATAPHGIGIELHPDETIAGVTANDVDSKIIDCGFSKFERAIVTYGKNVLSFMNTFTYCYTGIFVSYFSGQQDIRGLLVKNCTFHNCQEQSNTSRSWDSAPCWVIDVDSSAGIREAIIQGNNFNAGCYMGFYRGPYGVIIKDNVAIEPGNCVTLVYLKANPAVSKPSNAVICTNNNITASYDTPFEAMRFYHEHMFYGELTRAIIADNTWSLAGAEHAFESSVGMSQIYVKNNTLNGFNISTGNPTPGNSFFKLYTGVIYFMGNIFRSQGANRVLQETNPGQGTGGSFFQSSGLSDVNYLEGWQLPS